MAHANSARLLPIDLLICPDRSFDSMEEGAQYCEERLLQVAVAHKLCREPSKRMTLEETLRAHVDLQQVHHPACQCALSSLYLQLDKLPAACFWPSACNVCRIRVCWGGRGAVGAGSRQAQLLYAVRPSKILPPQLAIVHRLHLCCSSIQVPQFHTRCVASGTLITCKR